MECLKKIDKKLRAKPRKPKKLKVSEIFELNKHLAKKPHTKKQIKIMKDEMKKGKTISQAHKTVEKY